MSSESDQLVIAERILHSLSETERHAMREILRDLQQRITDLASENMDLLAKNRILAEVSARDSLTGLYNRWYVLEKIESEINRSLRHGSPMALMMLDLDHFKSVNDTYGHVAGDQVLQSVARLLKESCRVYDVPGRYGGEEFCLLLPETTLRSTPKVAERIRQRLEMTEMPVSGASLVVTASIGIAGIDNESADPVLSPGMLIDRADRALYLAKNQGRNRVAMWDSALSGAKPLGTEH
jgi:diguanylate cyclase (GGDEF)-like protein